MKNKHLSFDDRLTIERGLSKNLSFKAIGNTINKDCTTVAKEIKNHIQYKNTGAVGRPFFDCIHRHNCEFKERGTKCNIKNCNHYQKETCVKLSKPPYVCNGCKNKSNCTLSKKIYSAEYAYKEYKDILVNSRQGINFTKEEIQNLNDILVPLIKEQKQSIHHACINNKNKIMCSEREIYNLVDIGALEVKNIDLPRKVRYRQTPKRKTYYKIDKKCLEGRKYDDYLIYISNNPDINLVEMDTVEGIKGGKVLLTIHFVNCSFMLAFIREHNDAQSVIDIFNMIEEQIGTEVFKILFPVILTDNGSEFSNPVEIEINNDTGEIRTQIFYCEPGRSDQKGSCEVNHEMIRRVLPKHSSFDNLTQEDINLLMSHINSYKRKKLNDCSPLQLFNLMYGNNIANNLGIKEIDPNNIDLSVDLLKK
ncbi:MAG: IS30 family transposase [Bacilli bacterium]|nr:IS30 family transposase [Bacilli bacterium]